ncbi:MAG: ATP-binding cassette domain-containing protein [Alphaproteobacteria bacterium]|nr:MAG: ATP-binding cassette domain-containing protein [Alphaproteobacteria bacterium]
MSELLRVRDLVRHFPSRDGRGVVRAVDGVSLTLGKGETLGIVGESGCGKSTLGRTILRLIEPSSGSVVFDGTELSTLDRRRMRALRRQMQIVFQDPYASLDPRLTVGAIVGEPLVIHGIGSRETRRKAVLELLQTVGLDEEAAGRYPHEFSGGQRQRIGIARALALRPKLIIADEPVSALDVSIQSQILNLLAELKQDFGLSYILISHDLAVVEHLSDTVAVMYLGRIVETAAAETLFARPSHPYTQALISSVPTPDPGRRAQRIMLPGEMPNPEDPPPGCAFHPRCPMAMDICRSTPPRQHDIGTGGTPHLVTCHLFDGAGKA